MIMLLDTLLVLRVSTKHARLPQDDGVVCMPISAKIWFVHVIDSNSHQQTRNRLDATMYQTL